jgi:hypothetical protein
MRWPLRAAARPGTAGAVPPQTASWTPARPRAPWCSACGTMAGLSSAVSSSTAAAMARPAAPLGVSPRGPRGAGGAGGSRAWSSATAPRTTRRSACRRVDDSDVLDR